MKPNIDNTFCSTGDATEIRRLNGETLKIIDETVSLNDKGEWVLIDGVYLTNNFEKDKDVELFIQQNDIKDVIKFVVTPISEDKYILNLHSVENWGNYGTEGERRMVKRQLDVYMPIVKYFLLYGFKDFFNNKE